MVLLALLVMLGGINMGIANPAANNTAFDLLPEKVAVVKRVFRSTGGSLGTAGLVLVLNYFPDKALGSQQIFLCLAFLILFLIPIVFMIADMEHQWRSCLNDNSRQNILLR